MSTTLDALKTRVTDLSANLRFLKTRLQELKSNTRTLTEDLSIISDAQSILQTVAETTQNQLSFSLQTIATASLSSIFEDPYTFNVNFIKKRNKTEIEFILYKDGMSLDNPLLSTGGGITDILSFSLRIACLILSNKSRVLILDEPFRGVSRDYQSLTGKLLEELSKKLKMQFIIITHETTLTEDIEAVSYKL